MDLTYEREAELYYMLDQTRGKLRLSHATKALVESGSDAAIIDVKQRLEGAGFVWALDKSTGEPFEISATRAVISAYRLLGGEAFSRRDPIKFRVNDKLRQYEKLRLSQEWE